VPFVALSRLAEVFDWWNVRRDIARCLNAIDTTALRVPDLFVSALVMAEDHRSELHCGVDPIAMIRALWVRVRSGRIQGASTIEQQFVRVISRRYERSFTRKVREQALAIAVSRRRAKVQIATAYLSIAYYGSQLRGAAGLLALCGRELDVASPRLVLGAIARLKYPEPSRPSASWEAKSKRRIQYIQSRLQEAANQALHQTAAGAIIGVRG
jgi:penicillin-binding protein 1A